MRVLRFSTAAAMTVMVLALAAWGHALAGPVAVVVSVTGTVNVQRAGEAGSARAAVGMRLAAGDRVVPNGGQAVLLYRTGRKVTATAQMQIEEPQEADQAGLFTRSVGTLTRVATTDASQHPNRQGMIRPIAGAAVPIAPRNDLLVLSATPTLNWFSVPEATGYVVQIRATAGCDDCKVVRHSVEGDTLYTIPADQALKPGASYSWTVGITPRGRIAPEQKFRVMTDEERTNVEAAIAGLEAAGLDPNGDGLFMAALVYRDAGLIYESIRALNALRDQGMDAGFDYWQLRGELLDALGDIDGAAAAFEKAAAGQ